MSYYKLSDSKFTRDQREEANMILSAMDCLLHREHVIYCSSELTSGFRLYEMLGERGLKTAAELKQKMGDEWFTANLWDPNVRVAVEFAESVRHRYSDRTIVITPAPFSAPGWSQPEYLAFWEELLRTRIKAVWFNRNWEYSNGCAFEFAVAQDAGLKTFDQYGAELSRSAGVELLRTAVEWLEARRLDGSKLREHLERLQPLHA
jgi:hypothetical protein